MKKFLRLMLCAFACCYSLSLYAGPGYCRQCGCNRFEKDPWNNDPRDICYCGHEYKRDHYFGDRPVSFRGSVQSIPVQKEEDSFNDPVIAILFIGAFIGVLVFVHKKTKE